jgi:hypothetical protein
VRIRVKKIAWGRVKVGKGKGRMIWKRELFCYVVFKTLLLNLQEFSALNHNF